MKEGHPKMGASYESFNMAVNAKQFPHRLRGDLRQPTDAENILTEHSISPVNQKFTDSK